MVVDTRLPSYPLSKIAPPTLPRVPIARPRLLAELDGDATLILLVAPAGSGKTSLLAAWAHAHRQETATGKIVIWYGLDPSDQEPTRLADGLAAAVELALPGRGLPARMLLASGTGVYAALSMLLAELEATGPAVLVLDNCHHVDGARSTEAVLEHLTRYCPPSLRLVLSSRGIPLLPALSAVASGRLRTLGRDDLQFTLAEAEALLAQNGLEVGQAANLLRSSHGWAMGLLLLAHAESGTITFLRRPSDALAEYLMTQVVDRLPESSRNFLLESALLGTFDGPTANAVLGRDDGAEQIDLLIRQGLFLDAYHGDSGPFVRYHDLFAEALAGAMRRSSPQRFTDIHTRAAAHYQDDAHVALVHAAAVDDARLLAAMLEQSLPALRRQGHWETIVRYGERISEELRPLSVLRHMAFAYFSRGDDAKALATADLTLARATKAEDRIAYYSALVLRANPLVRQDRCAEVLAFCLPALEEAGAAGLTVAEGWLAEIAAKCLLREGRMEDAQAPAERARTIHRQIPGETGALALARFDQDLAPLLIELGDDKHAERCLVEAEALASDHGDRALQALCAATRADLLLLRGDAAAAAALSTDTAALALETGSLIARYMALRALARAQARLGNAADAIAALDSFAALVSSWPATLRVSGLLVRARISLVAGDRAQAASALNAIAALGTTERVAGQVLLEKGALALADGRDHDADDLLSSAGQLLERFGLRPRLAIALILQSQAKARLGKGRQAITCLARAGEIAAGKSWLDGIEQDVEPALNALRDLTAHWRLRGKGRDVVERLLQVDARRALRLVPTSDAKPKPARARPDSTVPATERLRFSPFGDGVISTETRHMPFTELPGAKARELLAFAIWRAKPLSRDEILEALWDGSADDTTAVAFRTSGMQIRRFLGHDIWRREGGLYRITAPIEDEYRRLLAMAVSVADVESPADVAILAAQGLQLYTGPYLAWCYADWTDAPRNLAQSAVISVIQALVDARQQLGQSAAALEAAEQGLAIEPTSEPLRTAQMRLLVELGRPADALESYRRHLQVLVDEDLGAPSAALRGLVRDIRA